MSRDEIIASIIKEMSRSPQGGRYLSMDMPKIYNISDDQTYMLLEYMVDQNLITKNQGLCFITNLAYDIEQEMGYIKYITQVRADAARAKELKDAEYTTAMYNKKTRYCTVIAIVVSLISLGCSIGALFK